MLYMKIPDVVGSSTTKMHKDWIQIDHIDIDAQRLMRYVSGQPKPDIGVLQHSGAHFYKVRDSSSIALIAAFYAGTTYDQITIDRCDSDVCIDRMILHNATITRLQSHMHSSSCDEELSLSFQKITHTHKPVNRFGNKCAQQIVHYNISTASLG